MKSIIETIGLLIILVIVTFVAVILFNDLLDYKPVGKKTDYIMTINNDSLLHDSLKIKRKSLYIYE